MISSELPELIGMSDRILVMREGTLAGELPGRCERAGHHAAGDARRAGGGLKVADATGPDRADRPGGEPAPARAPRRGGGWRVGVLASPAAPVFAALVAVFLLAWLVVIDPRRHVPDRPEHRQHAAAVGRAGHRLRRPDAW